MSEFQGLLPQKTMLMSAPADNLGDMFVHNASGEEIPGYAPMLLDDSTTGIYRDVIKPNADDLDACKIVFNGPAPIPIGREGVAVSGYEVLSTINGTPSLGDDIGTVNGQWYLSTGQTGFKARVVMGGLCYVCPFSGGGDVITDISLSQTLGTTSGPFTQGFTISDPSSGYTSWYNIKGKSGGLITIPFDGNGNEVVTLSYRDIDEAYFSLGFSMNDGSGLIRSGDIYTNQSGVNINNLSGSVVVEKVRFEVFNSGRAREGVRMQFGTSSEALVAECVILFIIGFFNSEDSFTLSIGY